MTVVYPGEWGTGEWGAGGESTEGDKSEGTEVGGGVTRRSADAVCADSMVSTQKGAHNQVLVMLLFQCEKKVCVCWLQPAPGFKWGCQKKARPSPRAAPGSVAQAPLRHRFRSRFSRRCSLHITMEQLANRHVPSTSLGTLLSQVELGALRTWLREGAGGPAVVIAPPGVGLTTAVRLVTTELGFETMWLSQGHAMVKTLIERAATGVIAVNGKRKLIVVDDFDATDTLLVSQLSAMAPAQQQQPRRRPPVLCMGHAARHSKIFEGVARKWPCFKFSRPSVKAMAQCVRRIVDKEGLAIDDARIEQMCQEAKCDMRSVLNAIEMHGLKIGYVAQAPDGSLVAAIPCSSTAPPQPAAADEYLKDEFDDGMDVVDRILRGEVRTVHECMHLTSMDTSVVTMGVFENYTDATVDVQDCAAISDMMSAADVFDKRAYSKQAWDLLDYHSTLSVACVAVGVRARKKITKPEKFGIVWSKISNQSAKLKNYRAMCQAMQDAGFTTMGVTDLAYLQAIVARATSDRDEAALRRGARGLDAPGVLALMRLWKTGYKTSTHTWVKKVLNND
jgi:DNA polymerase III delta prime subunit